MTNPLPAVRYLCPENAYFRLRHFVPIQRPVWDELRSRVPNTIALLGSALLISSALGTWLGVKAARNRGGMTEKVVLLSGSVSFSFPSFFVQLVLLLLFAYTFPIFPLRGSVSIPVPHGTLDRLLDYIWHLLLPAGSLVLLGFGSWAIYVRNLMVKTLGEDYILLARAKGLRKDGSSGTTLSVPPCPPY